MITLKQVNKAIAALGGKEELVKGDGYYYFIEGNAFEWDMDSVYVNTLNEMPFERWVEEWQYRHDEYAARIAKHK